MVGRMEVAGVMREVIFQQCNKVKVNLTVTKELIEVGLWSMAEQQIMSVIFLLLVQL